MKRRMALWLSVLMVLGLLPTTAMATEESDALTEGNLTEEIFGEGTEIEEIILQDLAWTEDGGMEIGATAELRLHDNNAYSDRSSTQSVSVGESIELTDFSQSTQARYFAFASAANLVAWNTEPDGSGEDYNTAEIITVSEDLDLYGRWVDMKIGIDNEYYPADESASGDGWRYDGNDTLYLDGYSGGMIYAPRGMSIIVEGESVITGDIICEEDLHITAPENASLTISGSIMSGDFELIAHGDVIITTDSFTAVDVRNDVFMTGSSMVEIEANGKAIACGGQLTITSGYCIYCGEDPNVAVGTYDDGSYLRLEQKLALAIDNLAWTGERSPAWELTVGSEEQVLCYEVRYFYSETPDEIPDKDAWLGWYTCEVGETLEMPASVMRRHGAGYYRFDVRAWSADPLAAASCPWTDFSDPWYFAGPSEKMESVYNLKVENGILYFNFKLPEEESSVDFYMELYRREAYGDILLGGYGFGWGSSEEVISAEEDLFDRFPEMYEGGTFYVTVTVTGDGIVTADSDPVYSEDWTYICPDKQLVITDPVWNGDMTMNWQCADADIVDYYEVQFQIVTEGDIFDPDDWDDWMGYYPEEEAWAVEEYTLNYFGSGTYYFRVKAYPNDPNEAVPSEWTQWSAGFVYNRPTTVLDVTDLAWKDGTQEMTWSLGEADPNLVDRCRVRVFYAKDAAPTLYEYDSSYLYTVYAEDLPFTLPADMVMDYGAGYYAFRVIAYSADPLQAVDGAWSELSPALYFAGPEQKAPQASNLAWNVYREDETYSEEEMGTISFKNPCYDAEERPKTQFHIHVYRKEASGDVLIGKYTTSARNAYGNSNPFDMLPELYESGTYYFTVTTIGDGVTIGDSDPVRSEDWTYTRPDVQLEVTDPVWGDGMTMQWTSGSTMPDYYEIRVQYVGEDEEFYPEDWHFSMTTGADAVSALISASRLNKYGAGRYYFQIRAVSADPTVAVPSEWSAWSAPKHYMTAKLTELGTNSLTLNVCGAAKAELFMAVYDEDGRMIGAGHNDMGQMSVDGNSHSVTFDGDPATVKVFALDAGGTPYGEAMTLEASLLEGYVLVTDSELSVGSLASSDKALVEVLHLDGTDYEVFEVQTRRTTADGVRATQYKAPDGTWVTITKDMDNENFIPYGFYGFTMTEDGEIILYDLGTDDRSEAQVLRGTVKADGSQKFIFGDRTDLVTDKDTVLHLVTSKSVNTYEGYKNIKLDETSVDALIIYKNRVVKEIYVIE